MTYQRSGFRPVDRGYNESILLIPGWATDSDIFGKLDLPFNYILPDKMAPYALEEAAASVFGNMKAQGLHILGWSMGGFIAARIASKCPSIFKSVTLVSVRRQYEEDEIRKIKVYLKRNAKAYLVKFYGGLFSDEEVMERSWFDTDLLPGYLSEMKAEYLSEGLDYLSRTGLECEGLRGCDVRFVHGDSDGIAPIEEAKAAAGRLPDAKFITIKGARHLPFMNKGFKESMGFCNG